MVVSRRVGAGIKPESSARAAVPLIMELSPSPHVSIFKSFTTNQLCKYSSALGECPRMPRTIQPSARTALQILPLVCCPGGRAIDLIRQSDLLKTQYLKHGLFRA